MRSKEKLPEVAIVTIIMIIYFHYDDDNIFCSFPGQEKTCEVAREVIVTSEVKCFLCWIKETTMTYPGTAIASMSLSRG